MNLQNEYLFDRHVQEIINKYNTFNTPKRQYNIIIKEKIRRAYDELPKYVHVFKVVCEVNDSYCVDMFDEHIKKQPKDLQNQFLSSGMDGAAKGNQIQLCKKLLNGLTQSLKTITHFDMYVGDSLWIACEQGNEEMVNLLVPYCKIHKLNWCMRACKNMKIANILIDHKANNFRGGMISAGKQNNLEMIDYFEKKTVCDLTYFKFYGACEGGQRDLIAEIMKNSQTYSHWKAIDILCMHGHVKVAKYFLMDKWKYLIDDDTQVIFRVALSSKDLDFLKWVVLMDKKNDIKWNECTEQICRSNLAIFQFCKPFLRSPDKIYILTRALQHGNIEVVDDILSTCFAGDNIILSRGFLDRACDSSVRYTVKDNFSIECIERMIERGATIIKKFLRNTKYSPEVRECLRLANRDKEMKRIKAISKIHSNYNLRSRTIKKT